MNEITEILFALLLLTDLCLAASSRLLHVIRLTAWQGVMLGLLPFAFRSWGAAADWPWTSGCTALVTLGIKGILLPVLLRRTMIKAEVKRELEPFVGYAASAFLVLAAATLFFAGTAHWFPAAEPGRSLLGIPAALTTVFTGLFIIMARRKAITQAIGFLVFENGITFFGLAMRIENSFLVELGILLDVFVLVFVMGIALFHIQKEFAHIDADRLHALNDTANAAGEAKE